MKTPLPLLVALLLLLSCNQKSTNKSNAYSLVKSEKQLSFPLDNNTKSFILALFPYTDANGKEYLTFQNQGQNQILFYDMNSGKLEFKVEPEYEGPNGVGEFLGYYIHNPDSIFLSFSYEGWITLVNREATVLDKIVYNKAEDGTTVGHFNSVTSQPTVMIGNKMYILPCCNRWIEKDPMCAFIDLNTKKVQALPLTYPSFPGSDNKAKRFSVEGHLSRSFNGEHFIYSFDFDEDIYVASLAHDSIRRIKVKSKLIDKVKILDDYGNVTPEGMCANPNYGNFLYDKYRNVYYRVAYPETEIEQGVRGMELLQCGRKRFSIIILDNNFNIIGETLLPDYTYNSTVLFIRADGLYISESHYMNPEYSDDILSFRRFDLKPI